MTFPAICLLAAAIPFENPIWRLDAPDPTIWRGTDRYYCATTTQMLLESDDLIHWRDTGRRTLEDAEYDWILHSWKNIFAPDVVKIGNKWCLYMTFITSAVHSGIAVFTSDSPDGPFRNPRLLVTGEIDGGRDNIDAEVVQDPKTGRVWLFWGHRSIRRVELTKDGQKRLPGAPIVHVAGVPEGEKRALSDEGTYVYEHDGKWYLFLSEGVCFDHRYRIAVGRSDSLDGEFFDKEGRPMKKGYATTIMWTPQGETFFGPGHNGEIIKGPSGKTYMFYHCHWKGMKGDEADWFKMWPRKNYIPRMLCVQEIKWDKDGWPYFDNERPAASGVFE